ncbi:MAG: MATE family efflux transporter [Pygmaiobacter sp.]
MEEQHIFESLPPTRLFFKCAIPSVISMAVTSLYTVIDGVFVGRFLGGDALAAVSLVMPFVIISFALSDMVAVGSSVQIAICLGQKEETQASRIFSYCSALILLISTLVGLIAFFLAGPLVRLMGANEVVTALAVEYMRVFAVFSPIIMIFFAVDNYLRICGLAKYSMGINVALSTGSLSRNWAGGSGQRLSPPASALRWERCWVISPF